MYNDISIALKEFAMGDNRGGSTDCRAFGCIPLEKIEGTVSFRFWPFSEFGGVE